MSRGSGQTGQVSPPSDLGDPSQTRAIIIKTSSSRPPLPPSESQCHCHITFDIGANNNNVTLNKTRGMTFLTKTVGKYFLLKLHYSSLPDV